MMVGISVETFAPFGLALLDALNASCQEKSSGDTRNYFKGSVIDDIAWDMGSRGLRGILDPRTNPEGTPKLPDRARLRNSKSAQQANENLNKFARFQRQWMNSPQVRLNKSKAGMTFWDNAVFASPSWRATGPLDRPPLRNEQFFRFLLPLRLRFSARVTHVRDDAPAASWWPDLWRLINHAGGQFKEPFECEPLALFAWPGVRDTDIEPRDGWPQWVRGQEAAGRVIPTPRTLYEAVSQIGDAREVLMAGGDTGA